MQKNEILNRVTATGVMAVVRVETIERAKEIAAGCISGGVDIMEISYTFPNAGEIIRALKNEYPEALLVGAGTVLDAETARLAMLAGASFIFAPTFNKEVAKCCNRYQIPYIPGCTSLTEMVTALEYGAALIKAFPISDFYGPKLAKTVKTTIPYVPLLASGGVTLENIPEWFQAGIDCVGLGSLLTKGSQADIRLNAQKLVSAVQKYRSQNM